MKLLTKEIEKRFKQIGSQQDKLDPIVVCKFFNPMGAGTWYATEMFYRTAEGDILNDKNCTLTMDSPKVLDIIFFGWAEIQEGEFGTFSLNELKNIRLRGGLRIERDKYMGENKCLVEHYRHGKRTMSEIDCYEGW